LHIILRRWPTSYLHFSIKNQKKVQKGTNDYQKTCKSINLLFQRPPKIQILSYITLLPPAGGEKGQGDEVDKKKKEPPILI
jgi:hypothetical protein